ncbi:MAG: Hint domain-containing protein [Marinibacterium sp.]
MTTGFLGTFVISWEQTELDGSRGIPPDRAAPGSLWSWTGEPVRLDGPSDVLRLKQRPSEAALRRRAARRLRHVLGAVVPMEAAQEPSAPDDPPPDTGIVLTDGRQKFVATLIEVGQGVAPLLMFVDDLPPRQTDLWIVEIMRPVSQRSGRRTVGGPGGSGVICFTPGSRIDTPDGARPVEDLRPGDQVATRDNGAQEILWIGSRRMSGARLHALPSLRPIRFGPGALGIEQPDDTLLVSPDHRMLIRTPAANALFGTPEVLVPARELVDGHGVRVDRSVREVCYIHLLLADHQVLTANGVACESFHPNCADPDLLTQADRASLAALDPRLIETPSSYGGFARRALSTAEAAILRHDAA